MCNLKDTSKVTKKFPRTICNGCRELINPNIEITAILVKAHHDLYILDPTTYIRCHVYLPVLGSGPSEGPTGYCRCHFRMWYLFEFCDDNVTDDNTFKVKEVSENKISL